MPLKVLYVEDDASSRYVMGVIFSLTNYELIEASSGRSGWELALSAQPDIVIMDIFLPDISGLTVIRWMKEAHALQHIPVIVLTSDDSLETQQACEALGCVNILYKPVNRFELLDAIHAVGGAPVTTVPYKKHEQKPAQRLSR